MGSVSLAVLCLLSGDPPAGGLSPLAWAIVVPLALVCATAIPALWYRGNNIQDTMYEDLKKCNETRLEQEEEILGLLKVLRLQMGPPRGGKSK